MFRFGWLLAGAALAAMLVAAYLESDPPDRPARVSAPAPGDPCEARGDDRVAIPDGTGEIPLGGYANLVATGEGYVWVPVADAEGRVTLLRLDPASGAVERLPYEGSGEVRVAAGGGAAWLADPQTGELTRLDVATGHRTVTRPFGRRRAPREIAVGPDDVWIVPEIGGDLALADLHNGRIRRRIRTGVSTVGDVAPAGRTAWLTSAGPPAVIRLDATTGREFGRTRVSATALDVAATPGRAWVDLGEADTLIGVDRNGSVMRAPNGGEVFAVALGFGSVWATNYGADTVTRVDAATGAVVATLPTGDDPKGVATGAGAVWIANAADCTLTRLEP
jgi:YVTN family beta-propeller protein